MFPTGWPGLGLLLLRVGLAAPLLLDALTYGKTLELWLLIALWVLSLMLCIGVLTPLASLLAVIARYFMPGEPATLVIIGTALYASALALVGPGAYSIDRYCFGRRRVVLLLEDQD
jgi:putative oxidoreductase